MNKILIVDDQLDVRMSASIALSNHGFSCLEADSPLQAMKIVTSEKIDLILLDMNYSSDTTSGQEGLTFLQQLQSKNISVPVVVMTAWASIDIAVQAMQLNAIDFIEKPWKNTRLVAIVKQQIDSAKLHKENARYTALSRPSIKQEYFAKSPAMLELLAKAKRAALTDANILLTGENGTGKSLLANYIHQHSSRADNRFVSVNMGAIPESLFESELFGHKKGAFTDAKENRLGRFDIASDGTLFLDEIGTLGGNLQSKVLRVLETGEYEVVGSSQTEKTNARIISATNANLEKMINDEHFRRDLLFRLNTIELHIPPLRERPEDITLLAEHLLDKHAAKYNRSGMTLSSDAHAAILKHPWVGNVRELSHCIERAVIMSEHSELDINALSLNISLNISHQADTPQKNWPLMTLEESEKIALITAIKHFQGNVIEAGDYLGMSKSAIYRRLEKFSIDPRNLGV
ncbi:sigma-54-dependent transcriptional regulator [Colwellia psychrerythraea]|uniref:Two component, sigma54 specific, transcriptional regulator, Fis family n=1 Tax=Colwellia psychrerythraea TaxID=28229 RepID=A0A099KFY3_COLPS|nr:sigma-54 dependent transcriptional regulator [Colwellia psychrerythraea]KGJ89185.1 two component, sigma54 specific, transcriptional regulator, Fis family [Colwellia psychrerythraea]